jgi:hypothetical protein
MGEGIGVHRVLVGKPEGKRPMGIPKHRWEDKIKMDLQEVGGVVGTGWSWLGWQALVSTVLNFWGKKNVGNFLTSCRTS